MGADRSILHVDMDAFFASVEVLDRPELRGRPVLVGGRGRRGVVAAASYEARARGCRSAQPMAQALARCPEAVVLPPRFQRYTALSRQIFELFHEFAPRVEGLSIDEAFLDVSGTGRLLGPPRAVAEQLRAAVHDRTGLTCSVGISAVKFVAKIASALNKPDQITEVLPGDEAAFLAPLPVGKLWGVGARTLEALRGLGVVSIGDLASREPEELERRLGSQGPRLWDLSRGIDPREVEVDREARSVSAEDTVEDDLVGREAVAAALLAQATRVADRLTRAGLRGRTVALKLREADFHTHMRQRTLPSPTAEARTIYRCALALLDELPLEGRSFRLTGIGVRGLVDAHHPPAPRQLDLLASSSTPAMGGIAPDEADDRALQAALTAVRTRFGDRALRPAGAAPGRPAVVVDED